VLGYLQDSLDPVGHPDALHGERLRVEREVWHVNEALIENREPHLLKISAQLALPASCQESFGVSVVPRTRRNCVLSWFVP
jgi:hypothetical protein